MLQLVVLADDLTGAADTAAAFSPCLACNRLVAHDAVDAAGDLAGLELLAVYANSRSLSAAEARARVWAACGRLRRLSPGLVYKKLDSSLRGNVGAELDAVLEALGLDYSLVAPAYPALGRTTRGGVHLVHGQPVAESEAGRDPVAPVRHSRLPVIVAGQSRHPVAHVAEAHLTDAGTLAAEIERLVRAGARHLTCDAADERHLDLLAEAGARGAGRVLLAGSAGLAERLAARLFPAPAAGAPCPALGRPRLLACGTASRHTREQLDRLVAARPYGLAELEPDVLLGLEDAVLPGLVERILDDPARSAGEGLVLRVAAADAAAPRDPDRAERIVQGLGRLVAGLLPALSPAGLFLSGGDTASEVLAALRAEALQVRGTVVPGTIASALVGGPHGGLAVYTKAGAFGGPDDLVRLDGYWNDPRRKRES